MRLLTIDPGLRTIGAALSEADRVTYARTFTTTKNVDDPLILGDSLVTMVMQEWGAVDALWIERPIHRVRSDKNIRIQNLIDMAVVVGCFVMMANTHRVYSLTPKAWKGDVPKEIHHERVGIYLDNHGTFGERKLWKSLSKTIDHNARDAFALNLYAHGRINRGAE